MKKVTNKQFVRAYMKAYKQRQGFATVVRILHGEDADYKSEERMDEYHRMMKLQNEGVELPPFKPREESREVIELNKIIAAAMAKT